MLRIFSITIIFLFALFAIACGGAGSTPESIGKPVKSGQVGNLTVTLANTDGVLRKGKQEFTIAFADSSGKHVDVGAASLNFFMPSMGSMSAMNYPASLTTTSTPGIYRGSANIEMSGEWQAQVTFDGPAGKGKGAIPVTAQ